MTKFFNKFQKLGFWLIFGPFIWTTLYGFLAPCQNLEKANIKIARKCPTNRGMDGRVERQN